MQRDEQCGVLSRRLATLSVFSELRDQEWTIRTKISVAVEISRLREQLRLRNTARCRIRKSFFNINSLSDHECLIRYRFKKKDIGFISDMIPWEAALDPNGRMRTARRRYRIDSVEATAILLRRLSSPSRWVDLQAEFGKHSACLTEIFYHTLELFYAKFGSVIQTWPERLVQRRAAYYAGCIRKKGSLLPNVVGFIDGTAIEIARPRGYGQRATYSGHKRRNCVKFQAISAPDGLILHLFGPIEGRRHYNDAVPRVTDRCNTSVIDGDLWNSVLFVWGPCILSSALSSSWSSRI
jgi:DDE superfamily endonuclease